MNAKILRLAIPSIISNITVPLLSLVDIAIVGHMGDASYIGAISIGAMIFNVLYWLMGFLRMNTSGITAQAFGAQDVKTIQQMFASSLAKGFAIGLVFILFYWPLRELTLILMQVNAESLDLVCTYYGICIFGAPAVLMSFALNGWLIGMQNTRIPMFVAIVQNVINIILSLMFVYIFGMKIEGVALGTMLSQWIAAIALLVLSVRNYKEARLTTSAFASSLSLFKGAGGEFSLFLRTLCLVAVNLYFTSAGSAQGTLILAVNTLLMTFFTLFSYFLDGFAFAGEALGGRYYGAGDNDSLFAVHRCLLKWGAFIVVLFTAVYAFGGDAFLRLLTSDEEVIIASHEYRLYSLLIPMAGVLAFIYDGLFIGMTRSVEMLVSCFVGAIAFFGIYIIFSPSIGNNALWIGLLVYLFLRGVVLSLLFRRCTNS